MGLSGARGNFKGLRHVLYLKLSITCSGKSPYFSLSDKCYIHLVCIKCFIMKLNILKKILKVLDQIDISNSGINISPQRLDYC